MKFLPVIPIIALCLGVSAMGFSQHVPESSGPYPPKNYPVIDISTVSSFNVRKLEGARPPRSGEDVVCIPTLRSGS